MPAKEMKKYFFIFWLKIEFLSERKAEKEEEVKRKQVKR